jgi:hypothetical protein
LADPHGELVRAEEIVRDAVIDEAPGRVRAGPASRGCIRRRPCCRTPTSPTCSPRARTASSTQAGPGAYIATVADRFTPFNPDRIVGPAAHTSAQVADLVPPLSLTARQRRGSRLPRAWPGSCTPTPRPALDAGMRWSRWPAGSQTSTTPAGESPTRRTRAVLRGAAPGLHRHRPLPRRATTTCVVSDPTRPSDTAGNAAASTSSTPKTSNGRRDTYPEPARRRHVLNAEHWCRHRRPVSAEVLRGRLRIGAARARELKDHVRTIQTLTDATPAAAAPP